MNLSPTLLINQPIRVQHQTRKLKNSKDPELKKFYGKTIQDDLEMGYIVPIKSSYLNTLTDHAWHLPNHPVFNPKKQ